jgi:hypothetical protein
MTTTVSARPAAARLARALALAAAAAIVVVVGVWVAGGLIADDFRVSMALTGAWFALSGAAALATLRAGRAVGLPILAGYLVAAVAVGGFLAATTLRDRVVHEAVATGMPASVVPAARGKAPANVQERAGRFRSGEHATRGTASVVRLVDGRRVLTLTGFSTSPGPDLRVRIVPGGGHDGGADGALDLGALKGNRGDQQYELPAGYEPGRDDVLIWCRAFSALFGSAQLERA